MLITKYGKKTTSSNKLQKELTRGPSGRGGRRKRQSKTFGSKASKWKKLDASDRMLITKYGKKTTSSDFISQKYGIKRSKWKKLDASDRMLITKYGIKRSKWKKYVKKPSKLYKILNPSKWKKYVKKPSKLYKILNL